MRQRGLGRPLYGEMALRCRRYGSLHGDRWWESVPGKEQSTDRGPEAGRTCTARRPVGGAQSVGVSGGKQARMCVESRWEGGGRGWAGVLSQVKGDGSGARRCR